jgi:hypothetical protein
MHNWRDNTPWQGFDPTIFRFAVNICISAMVVWHSGHRIHLRNKKTWVQIPPGYKVFFFWSATPCASPPPRPSIFSHYSFWVHHLVNWDDRHLLAHAMASDFSAAWQCVSKRTIGFFVTDQTPSPYPTTSLPAQL